jgi:hypothetical protein
MSIFEQLAAHFPADRISWRVGSTTSDKSKGMALAYIDARDVMDRLDSIVGPDGWQCRYPHANGKTVCEIGIRINGEWVWKADGAGDTDYEAEKGALSDAFKRAAVRWGIGRYLYDLDSPWVAVEQRGKTYVIKADEQPRLRKVLDDYSASVALISALRLAKTEKELSGWYEKNSGALAELPSAYQGSVRTAYREKLHALRYTAEKEAA